MRRMDTDLLEIMMAATAGKLRGYEDVKWTPDPVVNVVMATQGYPGPYEKGSVIKGIDGANLMEGVQVFHAGTKRSNTGTVLAKVVGFEYNSQGQNHPRSRYTRL